MTKNELPLTLGIRIAKYRAIPETEAQRILLEKIGGIEFKAMSIAFANGKQAALIPLDESNKEFVEYLVEAANNYVRQDEIQIDTF